MLRNPECASLLGGIQMLRDAAGEWPSADTLGGLLHALAERTPDAAAILSATGDALAWRELAAQLDRTRAELRGMGLGHDDRVALVMANGPMLAVAFLAVASAVACAPLNPAYRVDEFAFYLEDLKARLLIVGPDAPEAAVAAAARLAIPVLEAVPNPVAPGLFGLGGDDVNLGGGEARAESVALLLHTSGTTSRPKLVPLRHANLLASARNIVRTLQLTSADRCLNLMPLFHIHGLMGGLLAPLAAGGSAVCAPTFRPDVFLRWFATTRPTWYTAVPTMHRTIVAEASGRNLTPHSLRFIRSSSAPLSASLFDELTRTFGVPVVEAYSMTEAAHQMTCNPLAPGGQKPGTVGVPAGPEVALLDQDGRVLAAGETGEIAIRGPSVIDGYEANPQANADAFVNGWFRTGDLGRFDAEGYLVLTGRIKEQINRGGEKISPLEIDQALLRHPEVAEAVVFGFPHPTLGEEVAGAVVLRPQARATADDLQAFLRDSVAPFKMPKRILILDAIPKGPTGKIQRRHIAKLVGMDGAQPPQQTAAAAQPADGLEAELLALWRQALKNESVGLDDDFFESGGDSLTALDILFKIEEMTGLSLPESTLLEHPTVRRLARRVAVDERAPADPLVHVQPGGENVPIFFFHGDNGGGYYTRRLARLFGPEQPFISINPHEPNTAPASIECMAADRLPLILSAHPQGPFRLGGYCNGGMVALEVARLLASAGRTVELVAMIDTPPLNFRPTVRRALRLLAALDRDDRNGEQADTLLAHAADVVWRQLCNLQQRSLSSYAADIVGGLMRRLHAKLGGLPLEPRALSAIPAGRVRDQYIIKDLQQSRIYNRLFRRYVPEPTDLPVVYYSAAYRRAALRHLGPKADFVSVPGGHWGCVTTHAEVLVADWRARLTAIDRGREARAVAADVAASPAFGKDHAPARAGA